MLSFGRFADQSQDKLCNMSNEQEGLQALDASTSVARQSHTERCILGVAELLLDSHALGVELDAALGTHMIKMPGASQQPRLAVAQGDLAHWCVAFLLATRVTALSSLGRSLDESQSTADTMVT